VAGGADRQPARTGPTLVQQQRLAVQHVQLDPQLRRVEVDACAGARLHAGADLAGDVARAERQ